MDKGEEILGVAERIAEQVSSWADLSNALFDPAQGLLAQAFPTEEARAALVKTEEYRRIKEVLTSLQRRTGLVEGATPTKSGRFLVRLPKSLHAALDEEAAAEGVSLNQIVVAKLALQLADLKKRSANVSLPGMVQAFLEVRNGASQDRVVADPVLNGRFLRRCRELGVVGTDFDLNWQLFNARKNRFMSDVPRARRYSPRREEVDQYEYASEMALRHIEREQKERFNRDVSLDVIICDPVLAGGFDEVASLLAPGFKPLQYRWAALGLRKAGRYKKQAGELRIPDFHHFGRSDAIRISAIPTVQGLYLLEAESEKIFVGETLNLRTRIERHYEVAGECLIPDWLYRCKPRSIRLAIAEMPMAGASALRAAELCAIRWLQPILNLVGRAA